MLSAGSPVGAQLPCSALGHMWGGESRGLFICLLTCFVSFLVCAVLENRRIVVSLLILFSSGCIHHADREGRHVHMKPRATAQASLAIAALSQSPPCCFSLRANIPMNFRAYFRALAQSFPLLCHYSSPLPVWCFKYQWLYFALKLPHEIIESACITINNWRVLIHEPLTLCVLWESVGAFNGAFELSSARNFRPFWLLPLLWTHYSDCRPRIFYAQNCLCSLPFINFKGCSVTLRTLCRGSDLWVKLQQ